MSKETMSDDECERISNEIYYKMVYWHADEEQICEEYGEDIYNILYEYNHRNKEEEE